MNDLIQRSSWLLPILAGLAAACSSEKHTPADSAADLPLSPVVDAAGDTRAADVTSTLDAPSVDGRPAVDQPSGDGPVDAPIGNDADAIDVGNEAGVVDGGASCPLLLQEPQVTSDGTIYWNWRLDWQVPNLKEICTTYGDDARMVVELVLAEGFSTSMSDPRTCSDAEIQNGGLTKCMVAKSNRFEFGCTAGGPYSNPNLTTMGATLLAGYYHVESTLYPNPPRHQLKSDPDCPRSLSLGEGLPLPPSPLDGAVGCPMVPSTWRVDEAGRTLWWAHFNWQQDDLASVCASYGPGAKMVLELVGAANDQAASLPTCSNAEVMGGGTQVCAVANSWRVETECTKGDILFESPATTLGSPTGYYHIESSLVPDSARRFVDAQSPCVRDARPGTGPVLSASALAAGPQYPAAVDASPYGFEKLTEPAANGQPCRVNSDCPRSPMQQICFIDTELTACPDTPIGRCVANFESNCILYKGCACARFYGTTCASAPGFRCGHLDGCSACSLSAAAGL
jgi:hypothetical protein